jgi:hypothetical protein
MDHRTAASFLIAGALTLCVYPAEAGACAGQVAEFEQLLQQQPDAVGTAPESADALLRRQPTPASIENAKRSAKTEIATTLAQAKAFDAQGNQDACIDALAKAKLLLNP